MPLERGPKIELAERKSNVGRRNRAGKGQSKGHYMEEGNKNGNRELGAELAEKELQKELEMKLGRSLLKELELREPMASLT